MLNTWWYNRAPLTFHDLAQERRESVGVDPLRCVCVCSSSAVVEAGPGGGGGLRQSRAEAQPADDAHRGPPQPLHHQRGLGQPPALQRQLLPPGYTARPRAVCLFGGVMVAGSPFCLKSIGVTWFRALEL